MKILQFRRRRAAILLIGVSFIVMVMIGIKVHTNIDLDALETSKNFMKQGLIHYTVDEEEEKPHGKTENKKKYEQHKHNQDQLAFLNVINLAAVKKRNELSNIAQKKVLDKLVEVGFMEHNVQLDRETRSNAKSEFSKDKKVRNRNIGVIDAMFGVSPEKAAHYQQKMEFRCLDGNKKFPMTFVNDDYCDCDDGSDEPGTSACPNGRFYCKSERKYIQSSRVNDGICDCCGGNDEWKMNKPIGFVLPKMPSMRYAPCSNVC